MTRSTTTGPSTTRTASGAANRVSARTAGVVGVLAAAGALAGNLAVLAIGRMAGADMLVRPPGAPEDLEIGVFLVAATTIGPLVLGAVALAATARWSVPAWRILAWSGLALGIVSVVMPLGATGGPGTKLTLASMHVLTGVAWFVTVRRAYTRRGREA